MYDFRTKIMVIGIATGLLGLGLALPTGLAFGFGYGYGVRQGYSAFKVPSKGINDLKMSPDPIQGSLGMGLQTAEERTNRTITPPLSTGPSIQKQGKALLAPTIKDKLSGITDRDTYYKEKARLEKRKAQKFAQYKQSRSGKRF